MLFAEFDQYEYEMLDLRFELKEHINREEWEESHSDQRKSRGRLGCNNNDLL